MIEFKDFEAEMTAKPGLFKTGDVKSIKSVMSELNRWVREQQVDVINVETVVLPNLYSERERGSTDAYIMTSGELSSPWSQFIRVWYRRT